MQPAEALESDMCGCRNGGHCIVTTHLGKLSYACRCPPYYGGEDCSIAIYENVRVTATTADQMV